jgi:hypothetical protein
MDASSISSILGGFTTGAVGPALSLGGEALKIWNHYLEADPVKDAKKRREYLRKLIDLTKEVMDAAPGMDVSDLVAAFTELLNQ